MTAAELLSRHTSLQIGGPADFFCVASSVDHLAQAVEFASQRSLPFIVIGSGTNLLVPDAGLHAVVVKNAVGASSSGRPAPNVELGRYEMSLAISDATASAMVGSGVLLSRFAKGLVDRGVAGLEWAAGIPGTIGGAVAGNAGAHGGEISECLRAVEVLQADGGTRRITREEIAFSYRSSPWKSGEWTAHSPIIGAEFVLRPESAEHLRETVRANLAARRGRQPVGWSAGSVFRNPPGFPAGRLIERCGLKGFRIGGAEISAVHANFIVNTGNARASDVLSLIELCQEKVRSSFGVELTLEIVVLGER